MDDDEIIKAIYDAVSIVNEDLSDGEQLRLHPDTTIFGEASPLDSLALVNLIINVEEIIDERLGVYITIASERAMSEKSSPFKTISTLSKFVHLLVADASNE